MYQQAQIIAGLYIDTYIPVSFKCFKQRKFILNTENTENYKSIGSHKVWLFLEWCFSCSVWDEI